MDYRYQRSYRGKIKAVILDWAGTTVDFGSFAPTAVFLRCFEKFNIPITIQQARVPMGLMKKDHLRAILALPEVSQTWEKVYGRPYTEDDVDAIYKEFEPLQIACIMDYGKLIPGLLDTLEFCKQQHIKIGTTTGYTRKMMEALLPIAEKQGYLPDSCVCPDDVPAGRPYPWMCYQNAINLQVYPNCAMVKVGDTIPDIEEGINAGMWTVGVALSGNLLGMTEEEVNALPHSQLDKYRQCIYQQLYQAGAHFVVDSIRDVPQVILQINDMMKLGLHP